MIKKLLEKGLQNNENAAYYFFNGYVLNWATAFFDEGLSLSST